MSLILATNMSGSLSTFSFIVCLVLGMIFSIMLFILVALGIKVLLYKNYNNKLNDLRIKLLANGYVEDTDGGLIDDLYLLMKSQGFNLKKQDDKVNLKKQDDTEE